MCSISIATSEHILYPSHFSSLTACFIVSNKVLNQAEQNLNLPFSTFRNVHWAPVFSSVKQRKKYLYCRVIVKMKRDNGTKNSDWHTEEAHQILGEGIKEGRLHEPAFYLISHLPTLLSLFASSPPSAPRGWHAGTPANPSATGPLSLSPLWQEPSGSALEAITL